MVNWRTNYNKGIIQLLHENYGSKIHIYESNIPLSIRAAETSAEGKSIFLHDPDGKVAEAYIALTKVARAQRVLFMQDGKIVTQLLFENYSGKDIESQSKAILANMQKIGI